jgi:hypothetical protein
MTQTVPPLDASDLLASILADFGTKPAKQRKANATKPAPAQTPKSIAKQIALMRTGYSTWKPKARAIFLRQQQCTCCGATTEFVENEFYVLEHAKSQSRWFRSEGYMPDLECRDLPIETHRIEEVLPVSACSHCLNDRTLDALTTFLSSPQLCLEFPDD